MIDQTKIAGRVASLLILLGLLLVVWLYMLAPYFRYLVEQGNEFDRLQTRLNSYQRLLAAESDIENAIAQLAQPGKDEELLLPDASQAIASAKLRDLINGFIEDTGARLISSQSYHDNDLPGAEMVGLRIQVNGEVENLLDILYKIETARPVLFVDKLNISALQSRYAIQNRRPRSANFTNISGSTRSSLDMRMDIAGFIGSRH
tara:strand:- start:942 stop:1553 length:612 start_codon:yes stop_codon:yes gene_type:complete